MTRSFLFRIILAITLALYFGSPLAWALPVCGTLSLDSANYSGYFGETVSITVTGVGTSAACDGTEIQDNTSGSYVIVPASDIDIDCNGDTCSGDATNTSFTKLLKCESVGTYNIKAVKAVASSAVATVTCGTRTTIRDATIRDAVIR